MKPTQAELAQHKSNPNIVLTVGGKAFRCECGCNVFHHPDDEDWSIYACNACRHEYVAQQGKEGES